MVLLLYAFSILIVFSVIPLFYYGGAWSLLLLFVLLPPWGYYYMPYRNRLAYEEVYESETPQTKQTVRFDLQRNKIHIISKY